MTEHKELDEKLYKLNIGEPHPASKDALDWIYALTPTELSIWQESFCSCALEGNRLAEICSETLHLLLHGKPVSDRYLLGLAWTMAAELHHPAIERKRP